MSIRLYNSHIPLDPLDCHICLIDFDTLELESRNYHRNPLYVSLHPLTKKNEKTSSTAGAGTWHRTGGEIPRAYVGAWDDTTLHILGTL